MTTILIIGFLVADAAAFAVIVGLALTSATSRKHHEVERRIHDKYLEGYRHGYEDCMNMPTHPNRNRTNP